MKSSGARRLLRSTGRSHPSTSPFLSSTGSCSTATRTATRAATFPFIHPTIASSCCLPRRFLHATSPTHREKNPAPARIDQTPPTDISALDVLGSAPVPSTNIEATLPRGFLLNSGLGIFDGAGALLVGGEAFAWRPWLANAKSAAGEGDESSFRLLNAKGQVELPAEAFSVLELLWPRPDLLVVGVGPTIRPLSPETRRRISELGMRVEVLDTRNAASQFNLLATERGMDDVAAALIPLGWVEGKGAVE